MSSQDLQVSQLALASHLLKMRQYVCEPWSLTMKGLCHPKLSLSAVLSPRKTKDLCHPMVSLSAVLSLRKMQDLCHPKLPLSAILSLGKKGGPTQVQVAA